MRNVRVISFTDKVIEAGFQRIKPREEIVIQYDLLFPYAMHYHKDDLAIASIERVAEHVGKNADMTVLKSNFWIFPKEEEKAKGAPTVKPAVDSSSVTPTSVAAISDPVNEKPSLVKIEVTTDGTTKEDIEQGIMRAEIQVTPAAEEPKEEPQSKPKRKKGKE
jgi:hypothetical protein